MRNSGPSSAEPDDMLLFWSPGSQAYRPRAAIRFDLWVRAPSILRHRALRRVVYPEAMRVADRQESEANGMGAIV